MLETLKLLEQYTSARHAIAEYFGVDVYTYEDLSRVTEWSIDIENYELRWIDDDCEYVAEIHNLDNIIEKDGAVLVMTYDPCGGDDLNYILDSKKRSDGESTE